MKAKGEQALMIGWHAEAFARTKTIKALPEYLKPPLTPEQKREKGARDMLAKMKRLAKKKGGD